MNEREKKLAMIVGVLLVGTCLYYGATKIYEVFNSRTDKIAELEDEISTKEAQQARGLRARRILTEFEERALPSDHLKASLRYRDWLQEWVKDAGVGADVKWVSKQDITVDKEPAHAIHEFSVMCNANLPQLVELLYNFYSQDYLHRIKTLSARPMQGKLLQLSFRIEAVAMPGVADKSLENMPSKRLAFDSLDKYFDVIVGRNLYSPANQPPQFARASTEERGYVHQRMSFSPKVQDPESGQLTYRVEHDGLPGLQIDERTGRIEWTPEEVGEFEIMVYATDDGIPAKESSQTIRLAVSEPPPEPERNDPPPPRRTFDEAKYTYVTGIVEVNGRRQVWLTVRTDGTWLRLFEGDTFEIGAMYGKVVRIHTRSVEIESEETVYSIRFGQSLYEGQVVSGAEDVAASDS